MTFETPGVRAAEISKAMQREPFNFRGIRRTVETMLAGMGISKDIRAQLLSHGLSGVQAAHYDRHEYLAEKHAALTAWERGLDYIVKCKKIQQRRANEAQEQNPRLTVQANQEAQGDSAPRATLTETHQLE